MFKRTMKQAGILAGSLPGLLLEAETVAHSVLKGVHGRRKVGAGEAFWQFRSWHEGDSTRDIDWRQTAKRDNVFVRQKEWEAAQAVYLYRDASASMQFASSKKTRQKQDYAELLLLALSMLLLNGGEQVGLLGVDMPLQMGNHAPVKLFDHLQEQEEAKLARAEVPANAQIVFISDFYAPLEKWQTFFSSLAARNVKGTLLQLWDPAEKALPYQGKVHFHNMEGEGGRIMPQVEAIREEYQQKFVEHQQQLQRMAGSLGWRFFDHGTGEAPEKALLKLYELLAVK